MGTEAFFASLGRDHGASSSTTILRRALGDRQRWDRSVFVTHSVLRIGVLCRRGHPPSMTRHAPGRTARPEVAIEGTGAPGTSHFAPHPLQTVLSETCRRECRGPVAAVSAMSSNPVPVASRGVRRAASRCVILEAGAGRGRAAARPRPAKRALGDRSVSFRGRRPAYGIAGGPRTRPWEGVGTPVPRSTPPTCLPPEPLLGRPHAREGTGGNALHPSLPRDARDSRGRAMTRPRGSRALNRRLCFTQFPVGFELSALPVRVIIQVSRSSRIAPLINHLGPEHSVGAAPNMRVDRRVLPDRVQTPR